MKEQRIQIHRPKQLLENNIKRITESKSLSEQNKKLILAFEKHCIARSLSFFRANKYLNHMKVISEKVNNDLNKTTKKDIQNFLEWLEKSDYAENTKSDFKTALKVFFRWLEKTELTADVNTKKKKNTETLPEQLLTEDEVLSLINACSTIRDKAFISSLYESGTRISELGSMKIKHVSFDEFGSKILVSGKTGSRSLRLIASSKYLSDWINGHPKRSNPEAPLWLGFQTKRAVEYTGLVKVIRQAAKRIGLQKKVNPHNFRHSRATFLAKNLTEAQLKQFFGWTQASDMASRYVHLSGRDLDDSLLEMYGIKQKTNEEKSKILPKKCLNCSAINEPTALLCVNCQKPLTLEHALQMENEQKANYELKIKEMEEKMKLFEEFMKSKNRI